MTHIFCHRLQSIIVDALSVRITKTRVIPGFVATHDDVRIDRILGSPPRLAIPSDRIRDVLAALMSADVFWEGKPWKVSSEVISPRARIVDGEGGKMHDRIDGFFA